MDNFIELLTKDPDAHILTTAAKIVGVFTVTAFLILAMLIGGLL